MYTTHQNSVSRVDTTACDTSLGADSLAPRRAVVPPCRLAIPSRTIGTDRPKSDPGSNRPKAGGSVLARRPYLAAIAAPSMVAFLALSGVAKAASPDDLQPINAHSRWSDYACLSGEECRLGDVNNDGLDDLIVFTHNANPQVWVALSNGTSFGSAQLWRTSFCASRESCEVGDFNGDGRTDIVAFTRGTAHQAWVALSNGTNGFGTPRVWNNYSCLDGEVCKVADVNGDRRADVVVFMHNATPQLWIELSNGTSFGQAQLWSSYFCTSSETCDVGDFNGDGRADPIAFTRGAAHQAWVGLSTGTGLMPPTIWSNYACLDGEVCEVADVNADDRADLVVFTHNTTPQAWVAISTGSSFDAGFLWDDYMCRPTETCEVGDVDGDLRSDLIAMTRSPDNDVWIATSSP